MGRRYNNYYHYEYYKKTTPIEVENGISLSKQRGDIAEQWWSKRWISYLKSLNMGARLTRGKSYARKGQIISLDIVNGKVIAKVQGSYREPYTVEIKLKAILKSQWNKIIKLLASQAIYTSKLLNGIMPQDIEKIFTKADVELFPSSRSDLKTDCSCPDYANPCKHIAAVYYILAEKFDEDPFLIFELRGKSKDDLIAMLREARTKTAIDLSTPLNIFPQNLSNIQSKKENTLLEKGVDFFWQGEKANYVNFISFSPSNLNAELLMKIEPSPIILENNNLSDILRKTYLSLTEITLDRINQSFRFNEDETLDETNDGEKDDEIDKKAEESRSNTQKEPNSDLNLNLKAISPQKRKKNLKKITTQTINSIINEEILDQKWDKILRLLAKDDDLSSLSQKSMTIMVNVIKTLILKWMHDKSGSRPDNKIVQAIITAKRLSNVRKNTSGEQMATDWNCWFHNFWKKNFRCRNLKKEFRKQNFSINKVEEYWTLLDLDKE